MSIIMLSKLKMSDIIKVSRCIILKKVIRIYIEIVRCLNKMI